MTLAIRFRQSLLMVGAALLWLPMAWGCSGFRGPEVKVAGAVVTNETDEGLELEIFLEMTNPNDEGLELRLYEYTIWADGARAYQGVWSAEQTIPALMERSAMIPGVLLDQPLGWTKEGRPKQIKLRIAGAVLYIAPGQFAETLLEWGIYQPRQGFRAEDFIELIVEQKMPEKGKSASKGS